MIIRLVLNGIPYCYIGQPTHTDYIPIPYKIVYTVKYEPVDL